MQYLNNKVLHEEALRSLDQTHLYCGCNLVEIVLQVQNLHFAPEILLQAFPEFYWRPKKTFSPKFEGILSPNSYEDQKRSTPQLALFWPEISTNSHFFVKSSRRLLLVEGVEI